VTGTSYWLDMIQAGFAPATHYTNKGDREAPIMMLRTTHVLAMVGLVALATIGCASPAERHGEGRFQRFFTMGEPYLEIEHSSDQNCAIDTEQSIEADPNVKALIQRGVLKIKCLPESDQVRLGFATTLRNKVLGIAMPARTVSPEACGLLAKRMATQKEAEHIELLCVPERRS